MGLLSSNDLGGKQHRRDGSTDTQHPSTAARDREVMRWALPISVALTPGISVDFFYLRLLICLNLAGHLSADEVQRRSTSARLGRQVLSSAALPHSESLVLYFSCSLKKRFILWDSLKRRGGRHLDPLLLLLVGINHLEQTSLCVQRLNSRLGTPSAKPPPRGQACSLGHGPPARPPLPPSSGGRKKAGRQASRPTPSAARVGFFR